MVSIGYEAEEAATVTTKSRISFERGHRLKTEKILTPTEEEGGEETGIIAKENWLQGIVETEVETAVDEDADGGNGETTVKTLDTISGLEKC